MFDFSQDNDNDNNNNTNCIFTHFLKQKITLLLVSFNFFIGHTDRRTQQSVVVASRLKN